MNDKEKPQLQPKSSVSLQLGPGDFAADVETGRCRLHLVGDERLVREAQQYASTHGNLVVGVTMEYAATVINPPTGQPIRVEGQTSFGNGEFSIRPSERQDRVWLTFN